MLYKFLKVQKENPSPGDWTQQVEKDLMILQINLEMAQIKKMKKEQFKMLVKKKTEELMFNELTTQKMSSKKLKFVHYKSFKVQPYITSMDATDESIKNVFKYRTHMLEFDDNFKSEVTATKKCEICGAHPDAQDSVEDCIELKKVHPDIKKVKRLYDDDYTREDVELLNSVLKTRKKLLEKDLLINLSTS